jgi:glycerophosphoryl diester phosphodiesterase
VVAVARLTRARTDLSDLAYFDHPDPLAFAHRGFSSDGLENSMAAFRAAVDLGYRYIETDVRTTRDGVPLAFHDPSLDRVTDRSGPIAELSWHEVARARIGGTEPVVRLEDLLTAWPDVRFNVDVKDPGSIGPFARAIDRTRTHDRVCVASFSDRRRRSVLRRLSAPVATSGGRFTVATFRMAAAAGRLGALVAHSLRQVDCLQVPERVGPATVVTPGTLAAAHAAGKHVHVWTVNDHAAMHRLLDGGVDGLITDRADVLREVMRARDCWTDPPSDA